MTCAFLAAPLLPRSATVAGFKSTLPAAGPLARPASSATKHCRRATVQMAVVNPRSRVVPSPLPTVYVYDHCPFACRVRYVLGMKNVKHNIVWLLNDDVDTPTALIGKKIVPIFELGHKGDQDYCVMAESMDIINKVESEEAYGPTGLFAPKTDRTDITDWLSEVADVMRRLTRPRNILAPLPEFAFEDGRQAFIRNHLFKVEPIDYQTNMDNSPELLAKMNEFMKAMEELIFCAEYVSEGGLSIDDVEIFPRLRGLTIIKGLEIGPKTKAYIDYMSKAADLPNYYAVAC